MPVSIVTGATGGIGRQIALGLARAGHMVLAVGRDRQRGNDMAAWIGAQVPSARIELLIADLSLLTAACDLGMLIGARHPAIDVLVNNAGVFCTRRAETAEGHERVIALNHLSPYVLARADLGIALCGAEWDGRAHRQHRFLHSRPRADRPGKPGEPSPLEDGALIQPVQTRADHGDPRLGAAASGHGHRGQRDAPGRRGDRLGAGVWTHWAGMADHGSLPVDGRTGRRHAAARGAVGGVRSDHRHLCEKAAGRAAKQPRVQCGAGRAGVARYGSADRGHATERVLGHSRYRWRIPVSRFGAGTWARGAG